MGDGTEQNPYTREDVLRLIEENSGTANGLDLSEKWFEESCSLYAIELQGIILQRAHLKEANFNHSHLERAYLLNARLENACLENTHLEKANLEIAHLEEAFMGGAHLENANLDMAHLEGTYLVDAHLEGAYLWRAKLSPETRLEQANWGNFILGEEISERFDRAANTYRQLKQWYTNAGIYDTAGKFFFREMTANRKATKWWPNPLNRCFSKLVSILCGYGEKPERVVVSAVVLILGLAIAFHLWGSFDTSSFGDKLYYSAVSFTAVGYGNWAPEPTGWAKGMGVAEAFLGVFMMALFLVTFTKKMTR
ncbi:MAG: hypothetical protein C4542_08550 [Dehalococcoidia bacterium]|nr:MAG: hypothetical protein C4542_08550 [Dehalococcoidia bacterium]